MVDISKWNAIIVDDEPDNLGVIELVMSFNGVRFRAARSGAECLRFLEAEIPTFLLVDIQMPDMSGFDVLERVRANPRWQHLPVIAVTAYAKPEDEERINAAGFDGYISKPVDVLTLINQIQRFLEQKEKASHD